MQSSLLLVPKTCHMLQNIWTINAENNFPFVLTKTPPGPSPSNKDPVNLHYKWSTHVTNLPATCPKPQWERDSLLMPRGIPWQLILPTSPTHTFSLPLSLHKTNLTTTLSSLPYKSNSTSHCISSSNTTILPVQYFSSLPIPLHVWLLYHYHFINGHSLQLPSLLFSVVDLNSHHRVGSSISSRESSRLDPTYWKGEWNLQSMGR